MIIKENQKYLLRKYFRIFNVFPRFSPIIKKSYIETKKKKYLLDATNKQHLLQKPQNLKTKKIKNKTCILLL